MTKTLQMNIIDLILENNVILMRFLWRVIGEINKCRFMPREKYYVRINIYIYSFSLVLQDIRALASQDDCQTHLT